MFQNNLKIALRSLLNQKGLSLINMLSLSIGLATFSLFMLYAVNEFSFDRFHENADHIYQAVQWTRQPDKNAEPMVGTYLPLPFGPAIQAELPDVEHSVRFRSAWDENFVRSNGQVNRAKISFADSTFFNVFSFPLKFGAASSALADPYGVVLTEATALRLFGESNPMGKTLEIKLEDKFEPYTVMGVAENVPPNSSIHFDVLGNFTRLYTTDYGKRSVDAWTNYSVQTFLQLRNGSGLAENAQQLQNFYTKHYPNSAADFEKAGYAKADGIPATYRLQPILEMHTGHNKWKGAADANPSSIWMLLGIAAGVLLIACINFTTLAIGRSAGRAREVGVRKVVGGSRSQLVRQFLAEALLLSGISGVVGLALAQLALPYFNEMADRQLQFSLKLYPEIAWLALGLTLLAGLLAGAYPAVVLSGFRPVEVLKSKLRLGGSNFFTKALVTTQFVLSIGLAVATTIIVQQVDYMRSKNPGFQKENVVVVRAQEADAKTVYPLFRQLAVQEPSVAGIASGEMSMGEGAGWSQIGWHYHGEQKNVYQYLVDKEFVEVLGIQLLQGKNFDNQSNSDQVIVNEAFVKAFGWKVDEAVGKTLDGIYEDNPEQKPLPMVVGVMKDINYRSFKEAVAPQMIQLFPDDYVVPNQIFVRLQAGDPTQALAGLAADWKKVEPTLPFKYSFLDEDLDRFYQSEARFGRIIGWAGGLSVFLACLGLLGLAALSTVNRTKEIGVRKVLGASVSSVVGLLSKEFVILVILSLVIASPLAYFFMEKWLQDFAYRIDIQWTVFVLAGVVAVGVAFLTVSFQSIKAALANPVKSLRSE